MWMVCFSEIKEQSNLLSILLLLPPGGQAVVRMQAGGTSCPLGEMWAGAGEDMAA